MRVPFMRSRLTINFAGHFDVLTRRQSRQQIELLKNEAQLCSSDLCPGRVIHVRGILTLDKNFSRSCSSHCAQ